jgi:phosphate starvation-inducible protein PhoH and related proteins
MTERIIHFDDATEAADFAGGHSGVLSEIERALSVQVVARDTWVRLEGDADRVATAERFIECVRKARRKGAFLPGHSVEYTLGAFQRGRDREVEELFESGVQVGRGKPNVFPRTFGQNAYLHRMMENDLVLGIGPAGTGKTYLAMAMAISCLLEEQVSRIILTRPAIEAGEALGFLPGDMYQKVYPYLRPLYDALYDMLDAHSIQKLTEQGVIEVAPLAYMRGRTLNHAFVILDEAQNTTPEQMLMFLTRLGFDSRCVVTGDPTQIDLPSGRTSGLLEACRTLADVPGIGQAELQEADVVRHPLVQRIVGAYRRHRDAEVSAAEGAP